MADDILHTGRADIHHPKGPTCGDLTPHDGHPIVGNFPLEAACPGVPNLAEPVGEIIDMDGTFGTLAMLRAEPAAQQPLSSGDNPSEAEELATELAEERTLHQETIRERDELRQEVKRLAWLERMGHRHALRADQDAAQADARLAQRDAEIARLRAKEAVWNLAQFDAEDLRRTLAALNVALYWAHPDTPEGRDEIAGCRVALETGQAALERLRAPSVRPDTDRTPDVGTPDHPEPQEGRTVAPHEVMAALAEHAKTLGWEIVDRDWKDHDSDGTQEYTVWIRPLPEEAGDGTTDG